MKQMLLIVNPVSGTKKASKALADIISVFNRAEYLVRVYITARSGDATRAVETIGRDVDLIVCCGGDGTLNETVTGVIRTNSDTPIGYIPTGSTNDFANTLRLSGDPVTAAKQIADGAVHAYDVGKFGDRYFTYIASFGAFTKTSYTTPQNVKNALGHVAYLLEGLQELSKLQTEHVRLNLDGEILEDDFLFGAVCNSTSVGGILTLNPDLVDLSDGKFEVFLVRAPKNLQEVSECILALKNQEYNCGMITFRSAEKLTLTATPALTWSLDGGRALGADTLCIEALHRKLKLKHG